MRLAPRAKVWFQSSLSQRNCCAPEIDRLMGTGNRASRLPHLTRQLVCGIVLIGSAAATVRAADDASATQTLPTIHSLRIEPAEIVLRGANRQQQILVT